MNAKHKWGHMMQLAFPEAEIISLIKNLEANTCTTPQCESARLSMLTPRAANDACNRGIRLRKQGDLAGANEAFIEMFHSQDVINTTALWAWARVFLLAKDFRSAQLLMHADFASEYRGEQLFNPFEWINVRLMLPGLQIDWLNDGSIPRYDIYALDYLEDPYQLVTKISELGGDDDYWKYTYAWTVDDYGAFLNYFSPLAVLAVEGEPYRWTGDDVQEISALYIDIHKSLLANHVQLIRPM